MSKPSPIRGWLEPSKPSPIKLPSNVHGKPVAYVVANPLASGLTHAKSQQQQQRNYCKPVSVQATPTQPQKMPHHTRPQHCNSYHQSSHVPKPQVIKVQTPKQQTTQNKVVQNGNNIRVQVNNIFVRDMKSLNLNEQKPAYVHRKPTTSLVRSAGPKPTQNYRRRPNHNGKTNNGCVVTITNNFITRK